MLVLVTLGLVAFGLVMVYSATSAAAALGDGDPGYYLKRQGIYALVGLALLLVALAARLPARCAARAAARSSAALVLCVAVLVVGRAGQRRAPLAPFGPAVFQPSELAKLALAVWAAAYLARAARRRSLGELARPFGLARRASSAS